MSQSRKVSTKKRGANDRISSPPPIFPIAKESKASQPLPSLGSLPAVVGHNRLPSVAGLSVDVGVLGEDNVKAPKNGVNSDAMREAVAYYKSHCQATRNNPIPVTLRCLSLNITAHPYKP
jgi:hypothetical protein